MVRLMANADIADMSPPQQSAEDALKGIASRLRLDLPIPHGPITTHDNGRTVGLDQQQPANVFPLHAYDIDGVEGPDMHPASHLHLRSVFADSISAVMPVVLEQMHKIASSFR
jgi:hypothetical protein